MHYVSKNDIVPWIDIVGRRRNRGSIKVLDPCAPWFDHSVQSPTFRKVIRDRTAYIIRKENSQTKEKRSLAGSGLFGPLRHYLFKKLFMS